MNKKDRKQDNAPETEPETMVDSTMNPEETGAAESETQGVEECDSEDAEVADFSKKYEETKAALDQKNKDYLYLMADFDNFRKRTIKEKGELVKNAAEKVLRGLLPIVDDFERGLEATKGDEAGEQVRQGMELIYNKLVKFLSENGVKPIESTGADFTDEFHDAIATIPAPDPSLKGKVIDTTTKGYTLNDKVLRHAKVVVGE